MEFIFANPYNASKPLFPAANPSSPSPRAASNTGSTATTSANLQPSTSSIAGNWAIAALFNIPLPSTPYSLTITSNTIRINGGCNNFTYQYTINSTSQLIVIGNQSSTNKSCGQSDDQLYVSGINKMYKYLISGSNGIFTLRFYDQSGNPGYTLSINQNQGPQTRSSPTSAPAPSPNQAPQPLSPGTYLLLNLQRRDIPRALVNIT
jgi:heat shock protein HslJ